MVELCELVRNRVEKGDMKRFHAVVDGKVEKMKPARVGSPASGLFESQPEALEALRNVYAKTREQQDEMRERARRAMDEEMRRQVEEERRRAEMERQMRYAPPRQDWKHAPGNIVYWNGTDVQMMPHATAGQIMHVDPAAMNPVWGNAAE